MEKRGTGHVFSPGSYLNGRPFAVAQAVKRIARNVSQQGVGAEPGSHESVQKPLDTKRRQRSSGAAKPPGRRQNIADRSIPMGSGFKKRARSATVRGNREIETAAGAAAEGFDLLDTGRLIGWPLFGFFNRCQQWLKKCINTYQLNTWRAYEHRSLEHCRLA
jgi:hypothetical protein